MPQPPNTLLRRLVPAFLIVLGLGVGWAFLKNSKISTPPQAAPPAATPSQPKAGVESPTPQPVDAQVAPGQLPAAGAIDLAALKTRVFDAGDSIQGRTIGSLDKAGAGFQQLKMSVVGAGVASIELAKHFTSVKEDVHVQLQSEHLVKPQVTTPFAALGVEISLPGGTTSTRVSLFHNSQGPIWRAVAGRPDGVFEAFVDDGAGVPVLRVERAFELAPDSYEIAVKQSIENLSAVPLVVTWSQMGPVDLPQDSASYGGDKRRMRFGYQLPPISDPTRQAVLSDAYSQQRRDVLGKRSDSGLAAEVEQWPNDKSKKEQYELSWVAFTNRYYAAAVYPLVDVTQAKAEKRFTWVSRVTRDYLGAAGSEVVGLRMYSNPLTVAPGKKADVSFGVFAGPMDKRVLKKEPRLKALELSGLPYYNFGGPCSFCTFGFLTTLLLNLLTFLHGVVGDWAVGILLLVVIVRTCLHPLTKSTQIRMARFGKQMAAMGPKQKLIQEKYKDDPRKLQEETGKLWREEGVSPLGMLGCLPTFLQTPVWIALSATLYFAVELRHQGAFWGVFQKLQPHSSPCWYFLGDLAEPDRLVYFGRTVTTLPLLGPIESINILPLVLGVVFFIQQKYLKPPQTTTLTPEQEFQQKLTQWMMVIMFPLMMYNAPSGLALYFLVNSSLGILEARYVRSHMDKYDLLNIEKSKAKKSGGFMARLQALAEEKRRAAERRARDAKDARGR